METDVLARYAALVSLEDELSPLERREAQTARRERAWHAACAVGRCRYATSDVTQSNPPGGDSTTQCGGYHGARYVTDHGVEWRWRPCLRHRDWQTRRGAYLRAQMPKGTKRRQSDDEVPF